MQNPSPRTEKAAEDFSTLVAELIIAVALRNALAELAAKHRATEATAPRVADPEDPRWVFSPFRS
ncbi:MAG: hypothetical protein DWQ35_00325 [Planctomycetota bacterium]|nr:MAG: hypothetical protein DWQ35_00325 [Planctomycetota bacterium]